MFIRHHLSSVTATTVSTEPVIWAPFSAIPLGRMGNYTCQFEGQFVQWLVRVPGSALLALAPGGNSPTSTVLAQYGITMDSLSSWVLVLNASSRNNGTVLQCTSFADRALVSQSVVVTVFGKWATDLFMHACAFNFAPATFRSPKRTRGAEHNSDRRRAFGVSLDPSFFCTRCQHLLHCPGLGFAHRTNPNSVPDYRTPSRATLHVLPTK